jgi:hypothetical protein
MNPETGPPTYLTRAFRRGRDRFATLTMEEKLKFFRELGVWSDDGQLTTLYGGTAPPSEDAMAARAELAKRLFATLR